MELFAGIYGNGLQRTNLNDSTWIKCSQIINDPFFWALAASRDSIVFASTPRGNYRSLNWGYDWTTMISSDQFYVYATNTTGDVYAGSYGVYKSTDSGNSWSKVLSESGYCPALAINDSGYVFAASNHGIYRSIDEGQNWTLITIDPANSFVYSIVIDKKGYIYAGVHDDGWGHLNLYRSTDNGEHWTEASNGIQGKHALSFAVNSIDQLFVATNDDGVYRSTNNGESWTPYGLDKLPIFSLLIDPEDYLYAGSDGHGVFKSTYSTLSEVKSTDFIPVLFQLAQNYPNPFNPITNIEFQIPKNEFVTLKIYNLLGEEVCTLLSASLLSGYQSVEFDASDFASGVYIYRLTAGNYTAVKKMLLLK
jgi:hypothetical protein